MENGDLFRAIVDWLFSDAGAGWVFGTVSLAVLFASWLSRRRAQKIVCEEAGKVSLIKILDIVKDRIAISFDGTPVEGLALLEIAISNEGMETIRDISLDVIFPQNTKVLKADAQITPEIPGLCVDAQIEDNQLRVRIPYLNPRRKHKHKVRLRVVVDGDVENVRIAGGGEGWSVEQVRIPSMKVLRKRVLIVSSSLLLVIFAGKPIYAWWLNKYFGTEAESFPQNLPITVLLVLIVVAAAFWLFLPMSKRSD